VACNNSGNAESDHFVDVNKIVPAGVSEKPIEDIMLSRYACYLIVQNADPSKEVVALGQTYFAVKTRQQELIQNYEKLSEEQKRLSIRNEIAAHNRSLAEAAQMAGVVETPLDYAAVWRTVLVVVGDAVLSVPQMLDAGRAGTLRTASPTKQNQRYLSSPGIAETREEHSAN